MAHRERSEGALWYTARSSSRPHTTASVVGVDGCAQQPPMLQLLKPADCQVPAAHAPHRSYLSPSPFSAAPRVPSRCSPPAE